MSADAFAHAAFPRLRSDAALAEAERERLRGYADGHAEGYRVGLAAADVEREQAERERAQRAAQQERAFTHALGALEEAARLLHDRAQQLGGVAQDGIHRHAIELAEHIMATELADADTAAAAALRRALREADHAPVPLEIRLHPQDLRLIQDSGNDDTGITLQPDGALSPGDAILVLQDGLIDARVEASLHRARAILSEDAP